MDVKERQQLRISLLKELYGLHFDPHKPDKLIVNMSKLKKEDYEKYQAYNYLLLKSLIQKIEPFSTEDKMHLRITVYGIDAYEAILLRQEENN